MKRNGRRIPALFAFITVFVFIFSHTASAGLKDKIQQRFMNEKTNIQFQNVDDYDIRSTTLEGAKKDRIYRRPSGVSEEMSASEPEMAIDACAPVFAQYAIYQTEYKAELEDNVVTVNGKVIFEVFGEGRSQIPLVRSDVGLIDVSVNRGTAFVVMKRDKYYLVVDKPGRYRLDLEFLIKASREREGGPGRFSIHVIPAPISQYEFEMPETGVEIFVEPAIKVEVKKEQNRTSAWAVMPNTTTIATRWTKALPKETITPVKLEPKVYAETATYAAIGEGIVRAQTRINYSILQSEVSNFRVVLPEDVSLLNVTGGDLRDWKTSIEDGIQYLDVYLNFGVKGNYVLNLTYERSIGEGSVVAQIPTVKALGAERENGYIGIAAKTNVELAVNKVERVTSIDVKELPSSIWGSSTSPILLAFKYFNHPYGITIDVTRHTELPVLVAAVDSASYVTLHTEEGKILTKATYQVRNNVKQFLRLVLPKDATLWSTFVAGKPVKPAKDKDGNILIPLEKSQLRGQSLTHFSVEIVYLDKGSKMKWMGQITMNLPQTDIPVSELDWSVYFPVDYTYFNFGGDVKLAKDRARPLRLAGIGGVQHAKVEKKEILAQYAPMEQQMGYDHDQVQVVQQRGVLPIRVSIPQHGHLLRFTKLLVAEKESPQLKANYTKFLVKLGKIVRIVVIILVVLIIARIIKRRIHK